MRSTLCLLTILASTIALPANAQDDANSFSDQQVAFFEKDVLPILQRNCFTCHGGKAEVESGFRITSRSGVLAGGEMGPAVDLDDPAASELLAAINYESFEMPPAGKLPAAQIEVLTNWVQQGLPWSRRDDYGVAPEAVKDTRGDGSDYWAYQPIRRPPLPEVKHTSWVRNPIDSFILAGLESAGMEPCAQADKVTLIRRAYYCLTGLPPTPAEIDRFVADESPAAFEKLVDRLLASPQYGERWGRHWLDLVRYAETHGYERDSAKPEAWRYRDYVIKSLNEDKPYDRFVTEQLAGDELPRVTRESLTATGFYRLGLWDDEPVDRAQARYDGLDDIVKTASEVVLGTTMGCVRCHSHKADPIEHREYYQFLAYFHDITDGTRDNLRRWVDEDDQLARERQLSEKQEREASLRASIQKINDDSPLGKQRMRELDRLRKELAASQKQKLPPAGIPIMAVSRQDRGPVHVLLRGNPHAQDEQVEPAVPAVFCTRPPDIQPGRNALGSYSGKRLAVARWMFQPDNPLTARVMANRIWQHHFGRGIVPTANDFGKLGEPPTHPHLLDFLASELRDGGWTLKRMHKLIMTSAAWQMSSRGDEQKLAADPSNRLFWRFNMRRLSSEEVRDSMLAVTGELNLQQGGPSVYVPIAQEVLQGQSRPGAGWGQSPPDQAARRSIYIHVKRSLLVPILEMHDQADTDSSCPVRYVTTVPTQSLGMLNGPFTNARAKELARRLRREAPGNRQQQVRRAIRLTTGRWPDPNEVQDDIRLLESLVEQHQLSDDAALTAYCLLALNTNEFVYLD